MQIALVPRIKTLYTFSEDVGDVESFLNIMENILDTLKSKQKYNIFICGDFNINILDKNPTTNKYKDLINNFNLNFTITDPTRHSSLIDNIIVNNKVNSLHAKNI